MRPKIIILLSAIACIGGIVFFLACKYTYEFKVTELPVLIRIRAFFQSNGA